MAEIDERARAHRAHVSELARAKPPELDRLSRPKGNKRVYSYQDKTTLNVSADVLKFLREQRIPGETSVEDTLRRMIGMPPRPKENRA